MSLRASPLWLQQKDEGGGQEAAGSRRESTVAPGTLVPIQTTTSRAPGQLLSLSEPQLPPLQNGATHHRLAGLPQVWQTQ